MKKKLLVFLVAAVLVAALLTGCVESFKQDAVSTEGDTTNVVSNGGLAVQAGNYVYYINGYSTNDLDNTFGNVLKGAIVRATLVNGVPDPDTNVVIVPKIVYNTLATSGLYIVDGYLYYTTPNTEKDSTGTAKYSQMNLMRTKLDGTDTQIVKKFSSYTATYVVTAKGVLYYLSSELHFIDTHSKKFDDSLVAEGISANYFVPRGDNESALAGTAFFTKYSEDTGASHQIVYSYQAGDAEPKAVIDGLKDYANPLHEKGYTFTLVTSTAVGNNLRLIYRKSDSGSNTISAGTYSYDFDTSLTFDETKEVKYVSGTSIQYTNLYFLTDNVAVATTSSKTNLITKQASGEWAVEEIIPNAVTVQKIEEVNGEAILTYFYSSTLYRLSFAKVAGEGNDKTYTLDVSKGSQKIFTSSYHSSWLQPDLIGNILYFFNSSVLNYTYTMDLSKVVVRDSETMVPVLLSLMTAEDEITMLTA